MGNFDEANRPVTDFPEIFMPLAMQCSEVEIYVDEYEESRLRYYSAWKDILRMIRVLNRPSAAHSDTLQALNHIKECFDKIYALFLQSPVRSNEQLRNKFERLMRFLKKITIKQKNLEKKGGKMCKGCAEWRLCIDSKSCIKMSK